MGKKVKEKLLLNCGRKRKMSYAEAKAQRTARLAENPNRPIRIYKCDKCHTYHTTTAYGRISKSTWRKLYE